MKNLTHSNIAEHTDFRTIRQRFSHKLACWLDLIPNFCVLCQSTVQGRQLCPTCSKAMLQAHFSCYQCAEPMELIHPHTTSFALKQRLICGRCQKQKPHFDRVITAGLYTAPLSNLLQLFKFHQHPELSHILAYQLLQLLNKMPAAELPDAIVAVPLHRNRLKQRGYNQAELLANYLSRHLYIPVIKGKIIRHKLTHEQTRLNLHQRKRNIRNAFKVPAGMPKRVAIVDDVITTGSTADELARTLKKQQVKQVDIWCIAKTPQIK